jgi:hypothetical protein
MCKASYNKVVEYLTSFTKKLTSMKEALNGYLEAEEDELMARYTSANLKAHCLFKAGNTHACATAKAQTKELRERTTILQESCALAKAEVLELDLETIP